jgi:putative endonuclease
MPPQEKKVGLDWLDYYVYMLRCSDNTFYTGYTKDIDNRLKQHRSGTGARYVRCRLPLELVYLERMIERKDAMHREREIKKMSRKQKEELVNKINSLPNAPMGPATLTSPQP